MTEEGREPLAQLAFWHDVVPVAIGSQRRIRVVDVKDTHAPEADPPVEILQCLVEDRRVRHVDPGRPPVAGVEADSKSPMPVQPVEQGFELGDRPPDGSACAGSVLHAEPQLVGRQLEQIPELGRHDVERVVEAVAEV